VKQLGGVYTIIAQEAGKETAMTICRRLAGCQVKFPSSSTIKRVQRDERIRRDYQAGVSIQTLSKCYGLSRMQIHRILK
jgi:Mor family transcriptional regulator